ncbi:LytR C-terminal domain-containing protein [Patescibacteria group bacterium]|nr:LytR C-terminal domain-containing protein [Patescibacteria group bacterium]
MSRQVIKICSTINLAKNYMVAKKKVTSKESKEEKVTPEVENKVVVEEVPSRDEPASSDSKEVPASGEEQELSSETETTLSERPLDEEIPLEKTNRKLFTAGLIVVLFVFGITGWIFYLTNRYTEKTTQEEITIEEGITEEPTATPAPTQLEREEITLEIMNGSGVAGAAGDAAEIFEALGYEITEIGNADVTEGNELYVNPEFEGLVEILLKDVESELDISSISGELEDSDASARIILGE